jgi:hypothetical protein
MRFPPNRHMRRLAAARQRLPAPPPVPKLACGGRGACAQQAKMPV